MRLVSRTRQLVLLFVGLCSGGCGASDSVRVSLDRGAGNDPFAGLQLLRVVVDGPDIPRPIVEQAPYRQGERLRLADVPFGSDRAITVEGLDSDGLVVSRGASEAFDLSESEPRGVEVVFTRCPLVRYPDGDGDGFGDGAAVKTLCEPAEGFVEVGTDCDDADARANPDQSQHFSTPTRGAESYDYDCDGKASLELPSTADCRSASASTCKGLAGWVDSVPACGEGGSWVQCTKDGPDCVSDRTQARTQACR